MEERQNDLPYNLQEKIRNLYAKQSSDDLFQDDFGLYVPPNASLTQASRNTFDLTDAVNEFINGDKVVMLLSGESGSGKSFFGQALVKRKSESYQLGDRISIFISLPSLRNPKTNLIGEALVRHGFTQEEIEWLCATQKFFLFLDAYDEINGFDNLYATNKLEDLDAKIIISCRPSYLSQETNYKRFFIPYKMKKSMQAAFQELFVVPFVPGQVDLYITQYLKVKEEILKTEIMVRSDFSNAWLLAKTYKDWIEKIPGLNDLSKHPFLLRIMMDILPEVVSEFQTIPEGVEQYRMTQAKLYDIFIKQWYIRQENKLIDNQEDPGRYFQKDCISFAKNLAKKMHEQNLMVVYYEDNSSLDNVFGDADESQQSESLKQWALFFSDEMLPQDNNSEANRQKRIRARRACLLKKVGDNQWSFIHARIRDYFFTLTLANPQARTQVEPVRIPQEHEPEGVPQKHRVVGRFFLMNRFEKNEAKELLDEEGISIEFEPNTDRQKVVLGQGNFGKFRIARNLVNNRFAGVKKIRGDFYIKESLKEADVQRELSGLPCVMPIWDSQIVKSKRTQQDVLMQFMPLAGFGNGEELIKLLPHLQNKHLKHKFLIHIIKGLLIGTKGMHGRRVCHLDLKPSNFMLDSRGNVYIIDFGCAHREYSNKADFLLSGGIGDNHYFSPDRLAFMRMRCLKKLPPSDNYELSDNYDGAKADIWAIGITALELLFENVNYITGCNDAIHWKLQVWNKEFFNTEFENIQGWHEANDDTLLGVIKKLLHLDGIVRLSAVEALKCPLFTDPRNQMTEKELRTIMTELFKLKANPPKPPQSNEDVRPAQINYKSYGVAYSVYEEVDQNYALPYKSVESPRNMDPNGGQNSNNNQGEDPSTQSSRKF